MMYMKLLPIQKMKVSLWFIVRATAKKRPLEMFFETVEKGGQTLPRFEYVGEIPDDEKMI